jgi:hypothetical protein
MAEAEAAFANETDRIDRSLQGVVSLVDLFHNGRLDADQDGKVKRTEVYAAIPSQSITGDRAAALAVVRQDFTQLRSVDSSDGERRDISSQDLKQLALFGNLKAMRMIADGKKLFPALDTNGDTRLERDEIKQAVSKLSDGASKRALNAMLNDFELVGGAGAKSISSEQIKEYVAKRLGRGDESKVDTVTRTFNERKARLAEAKHDTFSDRVPSRSVKGDAPKQGIVGDCWLVAATSSLCRKHPGAVEKMIHDNKNGTLTVKFPYKHEGKFLEATVAKPSDTELALYETTGKYGTYGAILEKALGSIFEKNPELKGKLTGVERDRGKGAPVHELLNASARPFAIELLTGEKAETIDLTQLSNEQLHRILKASWNSVATCDSDGQWPKRKGQSAGAIDGRAKGASGGFNSSFGLVSDTPRRAPEETPGQKPEREPDTTPERESEKPERESEKPPEREAEKSPDPAQPSDLISMFPGLPRPGSVQPGWESIDEDEDGKEDDKGSAHEFAILHYDEKRGIVTVRNPWGHGELVNRHGKPLDGVDDGKMRLTLTQFRRYFTRMSMSEKVIESALK